MRQPQVLDPWALQLYAMHWRRVAHGLTALSESRSGERAAKLRRTANRALFAVYEIERFLGTDALTAAQAPRRIPLAPALSPRR